VQAELPDVTLHRAEPLGPDPRMAHIVLDRIRYLEASLGTSPDENRPTGVLMVKAGTKNQYDNCVWLHELGRMVEKNLGLGYAVGVAQSHYGDPTFQSAASHLVEERNVSAMIVVPYLFFPGMILKRNIIGEMGRMAEKYPHIPLTVTPPLGVTDEVVAVAAHRVQEVWGRV
jgi:sirohydrochlorin ferrochelatase